MLSSDLLKKLHDACRSGTVVAKKVLVWTQSSQEERQIKSQLFQQLGEEAKVIEVVPFALWASRQLRRMYARQQRRPFVVYSKADKRHLLSLFLRAPQDISQLDAYCDEASIFNWDEVLEKAKQMLLEDPQWTSDYQLIVVHNVDIDWMKDLSITIWIDTKTAQELAKINWVWVPSQTEIQDFVVQYLKQQKHGLMRGFGEFVIQRLPQVEDPFQRQLQKAGIPYRVLDSQSALTQEEILVVSFLRLMLNPNDCVAWAHVLEPRLADQDLFLEWISVLLSGDSSSNPLLDEKVPDDLHDDVVILAQSIQHLKKQWLEDASLDDLIQTITRLPAFLNLCKETLSDDEGKIESIEALRDAIQDKNFSPETFIDTLAFQEAWDNVSPKSEEVGLFGSAEGGHWVQAAACKTLIWAGGFTSEDEISLTQVLEQPLQIVIVAACDALKENSTEGLFEKVKPQLNTVYTWPKTQKSVTFKSFTSTPYPETPIELKPLFTKGMKVSHDVYGEGTIEDVQGMGERSILTVRFKEGVQQLMAQFAHLQISR